MQKICNTHHDLAMPRRLDIVRSDTEDALQGNCLGHEAGLWPYFRLNRK